ncbi:restriction endonuclease [Desulforegula conservatrix]|uniref:restriction endonuclease n=1 Tax=Desulforegula conservatrix TaxID=153026 RepID=UPI000423A0E0|nr:restriction endonuclease [Desulforegula conservatrix]
MKLSSAIRRMANSYNVTYEIDVYHDGLLKHKTIRGTDYNVVQRKAQMQQEAWNLTWEEKKQREKEKLKKDEVRKKTTQDKEAKAAYKDARIAEAEERTSEAKAKLLGIESILSHTLTINDAINWDQLKDRSEFLNPKPIRQKLESPIFELLPPEPMQDDPALKPKLGILKTIFTSGKKLGQMKEDAYAQAFRSWLEEKDRVERLNEVKAEEFAIKDRQAQKKYDLASEKYATEKRQFYDARDQTNAAIEAQKDAYFRCESGAISDYCEMVLSNSEYPESFPKDWFLDYINDSRMLVVDYTLPAKNDLPTLKEVKYQQSKDEMKEVHISAKELDATYENVLYKIALRTVHELFEADIVNAVDAIVFNGFSKHIDQSTGKAVNPCIMSVQSKKEDFMAINLANIDPKACFKSLKGVGSAKLSTLTPIAPIIMFDRSDKRFVDSYSVAAALDDSVNLAEMGWEDFEHLIREVFESEFSSSGGEVKVTRASRDGGVDAVAFDPDPIRGGKIVIQAKRYNNTVGVSAVRDLFGTVMNEGANKGILVTTSTFGPDAYEFANGKPITLLSGANLLHMLEKHGHRARIELNKVRE